MLLAEGLRHRFGAVRALDDISFAVEPGQTLAVFGPNGAGKTTLLKVLAGLIQPQRGRARVDGGRRAIGWIGHQPQLYAQLTIRENLRFWASLYDVPRVSSRSARTISCCASVCRIMSIAGSASCREAWSSEPRSRGR